MKFVKYNGIVIVSMIKKRGIDLCKMKKIFSRRIKDSLNKWVSSVGTGRYQPSKYVDDIDSNLSISENFTFTTKSVFATYFNNNSVSFLLTICSS